MSDIGLTLYRARLPKDWKERTTNAMSEAGLCGGRRGAGLCLWEQSSRKRHSELLEYCDGWKVSRIWLGPRIHGLAITPQRLWFERGSSEPSSETEWELVNGHMPPRPWVGELIEGCLRTGERLSATLEFVDPEPVKLAAASTGLDSSTAFVVGGGVNQAVNASVGSLLRRHGFLEIPRGFQVLLATKDPADSGFCEYGRQLRRCFDDIGLKGPINGTRLEKLIERAQEGDVGLERSTAILLGVPGGKGQSLGSDEERLLSLLDSRGFQYRLFSLDNQQIRWSAFDQLGSLLQASGGVPYCLDLPWPGHLENPICVGVDLGHPFARRVSFLAVSVVDKRGVAVGHWRARQGRDETAQAGLLAKALDWVKTLSQTLRDGSSEYLVLRDGRLHKHESVDQYRRILGDRLTFVEVSKGSNPLMFELGDRPSAPPQGTSAVVEGSTTPFLVTVDPPVKGQISLPLKINMRRRWDGLKLGQEALLQLLTGLSYAPSLGLKPHRSPAPIYWANGIASISPTNHQFSGQGHVQFDDTRPAD